MTQATALCPFPQVSEWWSLSCVQLFASPWTVARQTPLSIEFSKQEYWSGLPFPSPGDLPNPGIEPRSLHCRQILYHRATREVPYLLEYPFIIKGYNSGTARWKRDIGQDLGKGDGASTTSSSSSTCSRIHELTKPHLFGFLWRLHYMVD